MAVKEGLPATDFSKMNRDYIRNVAEGETVKDGLPATDFSRMNREYIKAVVEESGGGGGGITVESLTVTENDTYTAPEGKAYSPVIVNVSGGGSSDFTTVIVNFTANVDDQFRAALPNLWEGTMYSYVDSADMAGEDFEIVLYKGTATLSIISTARYTMVATGDIAVHGNDADITGAGTITITET